MPPHPERAPDLAHVRDPAISFGEFLHALRRPDTYLPHRNPHVLWGLFWGAPSPFLAMGVHLWVTGRVLSLPNVVAAVEELPLHLIIMLHPLLFAIVFGALGTREASRDRRINELIDRLDDASVAKSRFLASMSHELRTPLTSILGYSELLVDSAQDAGRSQDEVDLNRVVGAAKHLLSLINDVLDLSKVEAERMELLLEDFSPTGLIEEVQSLALPLVKRKGNEFSVTANDLPQMRADRTKVRQCLLNLLSNAAKFTAGGEVTLSVKTTTDNRMVFEVRDTGVGMTQEQVKRVFHEFVQAEASTSKDYGGTGLGLSLTRRLAQLMGGEVGVRSEVGTGSTFTLTLPVTMQLPSWQAS